MCVKEKLMIFFSFNYVDVKYTQKSVYKRPATLYSPPQASLNMHAAFILLRVNMLEQRKQQLCFIFSGYLER